MNGHQIDELLKRKVENARRGRTTRTVIAVLVLVALISIVAAAVHHHKAKAVSTPDVPSTVETDPEPSPGETGEAEPPAAGAKKPLQPEEMRRQQNRHELVLEWSGVPEEEMPPIVTLTVLCQGKEVSRFTLSEESEWRHSWSDDYPSESLSLRADLPKAIMASFVLHGDQFTVTGSYAGAVPVAPADTGDETTGEDEPSAEDAPSGDGEASENSEETETAEDSEASDGEQPEAQSGKIDKPAGDAPEEADEAEGSDEISETPNPARSWWPIVLLMLCGAVLVTLGLFGTDRRRTR